MPTAGSPAYCRARARGFATAGAVPASGSVRVRRGTADRPEAGLTTDAGTLHDVALGKRPIADMVESGDLRFDGDPRAISGLTRPGTGADQLTMTGGRQVLIVAP